MVLAIMHKFRRGMSILELEGVMKEYGPPKDEEVRSRYISPVSGTATLVVIDRCSRPQSSTCLTSSPKIFPKP
jgi:hypothetical protein